MSTGSPGWTHPSRKSLASLVESMSTPGLTPQHRVSGGFRLGLTGIVAALRRCFWQNHSPLGFVQAQDSCE